MTGTWPSASARPMAPGSSSSATAPFSTWRLVTARRAKASSPSYGPRCRELRWTGSSTRWRATSSAPTGSRPVPVLEGPRSRSQVGEQAVQRSRHPVQIECVNQRPGVLGLAPALGAHEAPQVLLGAPVALGGLLLEAAEGSEIALGLDDPLDG